MSKSIAAQALAGRLESAMDEMKHIEDTWGERASWPRGQAERYDRMQVSVRSLTAELEDLERDPTRDEKRATLRAIVDEGNYRIERGFEAPDNSGTVSRRRSDPWDAGSGDDLLRIDSPTGLAQRALDAVESARGLTAHGRELLSNVVTNDDDATASAFVLALTSNAYRSAFDKVLRNWAHGFLTWTPEEREAFSRVDAMRASMALTDANGGYLAPAYLDPVVQLVNAGSASPLRQICRVLPTTRNITNVVTSAGITAEWLAEGTQAADASPTLAQVPVTAYKASAYVAASVEILADSDVRQQLPAMLGDAFGRHEHAALVTGSGSGQPTGVVTSVYANVGSRVATTTASTFGMPDLYKVWDALPSRARQSPSLAWVSAGAIQSRIRQFDTTGSAAFWVDLGGANPANLLGAPIYEASSMDSTVVSANKILVAGAFDAYTLVDRLGTVLTSHQVVGANGRMTFQEGIGAYRRYGGICTDPAQFRVLSVT